MIGSEKGHVGSYKPNGGIYHWTYVGKDASLKGKTALVGFAWFGGMPVAQFDDIETGYGFGWHHFRENDFERR